MGIVNIAVAFIIFGLIVLIHEFGHFIFAKLNHISVEEFSIGMGPRIFTYHGILTNYSLKLLPIGGSCMMLGEDGEESVEGSFNSTSVISRISVVVAGPIFNFILAFIFALIIIANAGIDRCDITEVTAGYPAEQAGIEAGDIITQINDQKIVIYRDLTLYLYMNPGEMADLKVLRPDGTDDNGKIKYATLDFTMTPKYNEEYKSYMIGIVHNSGRTPAEGPMQILKYGLYEVEYNITSTVKSIIMMFSGNLSTDDISGPIGIVNMIGSTVDESASYGLRVVLLSIANMIVLLSANLGVMNLLPLPALDGGRLVFLIIEGIIGRPVNRKMEGFIHMAGFVALMMLMAFIMFNDIKNIFL